MKNLFTLIFCAGIFINCIGDNIPNNKTNVSTQKTNYPVENITKAYFASGCFWCVEAIYESVEGVEEVISGYAGGHTENPTYRQIGGGKTGHTETVEVIYDSTIVNYTTLVKVFYGSQDPTTTGQSPDFGDQYRSAIFYTNEDEKFIATKFKTDLENSNEFDKPITTEISPLKKFWVGEDYHQDYERLHPNESYIRNVSVPRLRKFQSKFPELVKKDH